jgi:hypothetical protein
MRRRWKLTLPSPLLQFRRIAPHGTLLAPPALRTHPLHWIAPSPRFAACCFQPPSRRCRQRCRQRCRPFPPFGAGEGGGCCRWRQRQARRRTASWTPAERRVRRTRRRRQQRRGGGDGQGTGVYKRPTESATRSTRRPSARSRAAGWRRCCALLNVNTVGEQGGAVDDMGAVPDEYAGVIGGRDAEDGTEGLGDVRDVVGGEVEDNAAKAATRGRPKPTFASAAT